MALNLALKKNDSFFDIFKISLGSFGSKLLRHTFWCIAIHFQRLLLLFFASDLGKSIDIGRYLVSESSTFVYDYKMSRSDSSARNSHLTQGGRTTMMTVSVNLITSQCKIKLSQKYCPSINLQLWNFCHSFLQWMGIFFLIIMFCSAIHVYTDRFTDMGIIGIRLPAEEWIPRRAAAHAQFLVINKGVGQFYLSFDTR